MADGAADGIGRDVLLQTTAAAGSLATGVAQEIIDPLRDIRDSLAVMVSTIDQHILSAKGPSPLPWDTMKAMRERLAEAYLTSRLVSRLTGDLAKAVDTDPDTVEFVEINKVVETAVNLTRHRMSGDTEVFIDFGSLSPASLNTGELVLALARLLMISADSARGVEGGAISIKTRAEAPNGSEEVVISVMDNGGGQTEAASAVKPFVTRLVERMGGTFAGRSEQGQGCFFELRWPVETE